MAGELVAAAVVSVVVGFIWLGIFFTQLKERLMQVSQVTAGVLFLALALMLFLTHSQILIGVALVAIVVADWVWMRRAKRRLPFVNVMLEVVTSVTRAQTPVFVVLFLAMAAQALYLSFWGQTLVAVLAHERTTVAVVFDLLFLGLSLRWTTNLLRGIVATTTSGTFATILIRQAQERGVALPLEGDIGLTGEPSASMKSHLDALEEEDALEWEEVGLGQAHLANGRPVARAGSRDRGHDREADALDQDLDAAVGPGGAAAAEVGVAVEVDLDVGLGGDGVDGQRAARHASGPGEGGGAALGPGAETTAEAAAAAATAAATSTPGHAADAALGAPQARAPVEGLLQRGPWSFARQSVTFSLGSLCAGALVGVLGSFAWTLFSACRTMERSRRAPRCLASAGRIGAVLVRRVLRSTHKYALAQIAMHGKGWFAATRDSWYLFEARGVEAVVDDDCTDRLLQFGCYVGGGLLSLFFRVPFLADRSAWLLSALCFFWFGFAGVSLAQGVIDASVSTLFACFAEIPECVSQVHPIIYHRCVCSNASSARSRAEGR